ncbi:ribosome biogenesis GTP-binding protein YihA/YsxC [uncultured Parolsenella sp.]|uniref:ribosome biogenesis GTP-binding protein YihA/YsxC n=1 Tax=uncultured Parolsenella sp. TaxID=2083008 RepID=UPI0027DB3AE7|nr:ribosome biogenesis GTP-binding protein YihA/YsxC [uncultured Parolsenella sp.]
MLNYNLVKFTMSAGTAEQLPHNDRPEIAFVGRSNVGKSSLMNKVFGRKDLVKVSSKPGKTTTINFFAIDDVDFVDLPGYGYARVNAAEKQRWDNLMDGYFESERNLKLVVALVDIRHDASPLDAQMIGYLESLGHPYAIAFTKADKLSHSKGVAQANLLRQQLCVDESVRSVLVSSLKGTGIDELKKVIEERLNF